MQFLLIHKSKWKPRNISVLPSRECCSSTPSAKSSEKLAAITPPDAKISTDLFWLVQLFSQFLVVTRWYTRTFWVFQPTQTRYHVLFLEISMFHLLFHELFFVQCTKTPVGAAGPWKAACGSPHPKSNRSYIYIYKCWYISQNEIPNKL